MTPTDPFEEGEQTLIRPDHHHHEDLEERSDDFEREGIEKPQRTSAHSEANAGRDCCSEGRSNRRARAIFGERNNPLPSSRARMR